ncbi:MAG: patatin-like phospholipase family protein, partial [Deltaproteobacteria bacterium]|nr:patatin-like phospholipase family protein [Deltaproteobacteria bacterium]
MGITLVQKSDLTKPKKNVKIALVLAGGAISGGAFKLGGLVALNRFLKSKKVTDFDIHVGLSAGAFLDAFIASGISPEELLRGLDGKSLRVSQFRPIDFYYPNFDEFGAKFYKLFRDLVTLYPSIFFKIARYLPSHSKELIALLEDFVNTPSYANFERLLLPVARYMMESSSLPHPARYIPSGLFDNLSIERYMRTNLERNRLPNNFKVLFRERGIALYICATNLNTARGVVFGHDSDHTLTISEAVQASTAIPAFYKPARIRGEDYVDGGVRKTANVSLAP